MRPAIIWLLVAFVVVLATLCMPRAEAFVVVVQTAPLSGERLAEWNKFKAMFPGSVRDDVRGTDAPELVPPPRPMPLDPAPGADQGPGPGKPLTFPERPVSIGESPSPGDLILPERPAAIGSYSVAVMADDRIVTTYADDRPFKAELLHAWATDAASRG